MGVPVSRLRVTPAQQGPGSHQILALSSGDRHILAPGPILTGWLADRIGLLGAMQWLPFASLAAAFIFFLGSRGPQIELSPKPA